jgi:hypothetical protein
MELDFEMKLQDTYFVLLLLSTFSWISIIKVFNSLSDTGCLNLELIKVYICLLVDYYDICEAKKCNWQIQYWCGDSSFDFNSFVFKLQEFENIEPH